MDKKKEKKGFKLCSFELGFNSHKDEDGPLYRNTSRYEDEARCKATNEKGDNEVELGKVLTK